MQPRRSASNFTLAGIAAPAMPMAAMTLPLTIFLPNFYASDIGLNLAVVGLVFSAVRLFDLLFDPLAGYLIDSTRSRWGRHKPWLFFGACAAMLGAALLFMPPRGADAAYLALALTMSYAGYSIVMLSQMGLSTSVTRAYHERSRAFAWWQTFNMGGVLLVLVAPSMLEGGEASLASTTRVMGWFVLVMAPLTSLFALTIAPRMTEVPEAGQHIRPFPYLGLLRLRSARILLGSVSLSGLGLGISAAVFVFYFTLVLHVTPARFTSLMALMFSVNFLSSPLWAAIGNRLGKHWALALGAFVTVSYMVLVFVMPADNLPLLILAFFLAGLGGGAPDIMPRAMMADVCDEDRLDTGVDRSGAVFALLVITIKIGQAVSIGIVYVVLDLIGFDTKAGLNNTPACLLGIAMLYCVVAGLCHLASGLLALRYPLTAARHDQIAGELASSSHTAGFQSENPPSTIRA